MAISNWVSQAPIASMLGRDIMDPDAGVSTYGLTNYFCPLTQLSIASRKLGIVNRFLNTRTYVV